MLTREEIEQLLHSTETSRVERTVSTNDMDKFQEAICAFSNDMSNSRKNGYLIIGAHDNGKLSGLKVDDALFKKISGIRSDGNILPLPMMTCERYELEDGDLLVVEVQPAFTTPVRYRGRTFIRIGPRRDIATIDEERILSEKRTANMATFDAVPCFRATIDDIFVDRVEDYIRCAVDAKILATDTRTLEQQMAALSLFDTEHNCPTNACILLFGKNPRQFMFGGYVQFVKFKGANTGTDIENEQMFADCLSVMMPKLEAFVDYGVVQRRPIAVSTLREETVTSYPADALRELMLNALMHRDYQSNMPTRFYQYPDRIEIMNPGGLYGKARPENFPLVNDYRNPIIAQALKTLGYVNMFNRGVNRVKQMLADNGNPEPHFNVDKITVFEVVATAAFEGDESIENFGKDILINDQSGGINGGINGGISGGNELSERQREIITLLLSKPELTSKDLAERVSYSLRVVERELSTLQKAGYITREGAKKNGHWVILEPQINYNPEVRN